MEAKKKAKTEKLELPGKIKNGEGKNAYSIETPVGTNVRCLIKTCVARVIKTGRNSGF